MLQQFLGEYDCKLDAKGRVRVPSTLLRQVAEQAQEGFVINRGFEQCLVIYPKSEWDRITQEINQLNLYVKKHRNFVRYFFRGATELQLDSNDRILLPKRLLEYAEVKKELVLFAYFNRIEVWAQEAYDDLLKDEPQDFADLAEDVMGPELGGGMTDVS